MARKPKPTNRKGVKAANQNPGGSKSYGGRMLDALAKTNSVTGIGMYSAGNIARPGDASMMKKRRASKKK